MTHLKRKLLALGGMMIGITAFSQSTSWKVDTAKATIKFVTRGIFGEVNGSLSGLKATILFDAEKPSSGYMKATIDPQTISTGISLRNTHLRKKEEFFNTSKYPLISFVSEQIQKTSSGYTVTGYLTIKAVTRQVEIPFTFEKTSAGAVFKGYFTLDALDYTVGTSSKQVTVYIVVPVTK